MLSVWVLFSALVVITVPTSAFFSWPFIPKCEADKWDWLCIPVLEETYNVGYRAGIACPGFLGYLVSFFTECYYFEEADVVSTGEIKFLTKFQQPVYLQESIPIVYGIYKPVPGEGQYEHESPPTVEDTTAADVTIVPTCMTVPNDPVSSPKAIQVTTSTPTITTDSFRPTPLFTLLASPGVISSSSVTQSELSLLPSMIINTVPNSVAQIFSVSPINSVVLSNPTPTPPTTFADTPNSTSSMLTSLMPIFLSFSTSPYVSSSPDPTNFTTTADTSTEKSITATSSNSHNVTLFPTETSSSVYSTEVTSVSDSALVPASLTTITTAVSDSSIQSAAINYVQTTSKVTSPFTITSLLAQTHPSTVATFTDFEVDDLG